MITRTPRNAYLAPTPEKLGCDVSVDTLEDSTMEKHRSHERSTR